jgi:Sulfotransferase family
VAVISRSRGYLFVHSPRTGGTAIAEGVLLPKLEGEQIPPADIRADDGRVLAHRKHATLRILVERGFVGADELSDLLVFTAIRNPFDLEVSHYVNQRREWETHRGDPEWVATRKIARGAKRAAELSFPEWLARRYVPRGRLRRVRSPRARAYLDRADLVMRFERLQQDLDRVLDRLGLPSAEIPRINVTEDRDADYRRYYDRRSRALVARVYRQEIERFGYRFRPVIP